MRNDLLYGVERGRLDRGFWNWRSNQPGEGSTGMNGFWILMAIVVLITALTGFIAYLVSRALDDDQWPQ